MTNHDKLGWRIASFLSEVLEDTAAGRVTSAELFAAYQGWCARSAAVPLLESAFLDDAIAVAAEAEIPVVQSGGNVVFFHVTLIH